MERALGWLKAYWRWTMSGALWKKVVGIGVPVFIVIAVATGGSSSNEEGSGGSSPEAQAPSSAGVDAPAQAGATQRPPSGPTATRIPPTAAPRPEPVVLRGTGQQATQTVTPPSPISVATMTHNGRSNFIVEAFIGNKSELLVNEIGVYQGQRPIVGGEPVLFDVDADGAWTITIDAVPMVPTADVQGRGDFVSGIFNPPSNGAWEIMHNGRSNFIVTLHCGSSSSLVQNEIGAVNGSRVVQFGRGPCFWEIEADGAWSLRPR